jgi:AraC family transcriptional regulator
MPAKLRGGCACGAVRFEVEDAFTYAGCCHCRQCRAESGSAFSAFAGIERSRLIVVSGAERIGSLLRPDGDRSSFCGRCGARVFAFVRDGEFVEVPLGALHDAPRIRPAFHAFVDSKAPWYAINDGLPQFGEHAPAEVRGALGFAPPRRPLSAQSSRSEYAKRLRRVLQYIEEHLDQQIDLEAVAEVAHFSPFHFHRIFAAWIGDTPADYVRSRRLDRAAEQLVADAKQSVLSIALGVGFGSGEAFARAFKARFGCTPSGWRAETSGARAKRLERVRSAQVRERNPDQSPRKAGQARASGIVEHERSDQFFAEINMHVRVIDFPSTRVAFLRNVGPLGTTVGKFWADTVFPWLAANGLADKPRYGIGLDNPSVTPPEKCRYDACVEVPEGFVEKQPAGITVLPGGRYAVRAFEGTAATIGAAWNEVFRDWLPSSAMQMDSRPMIEYYPGGSTVDPVTGVFGCELWVPVKPL